MPEPTCFANSEKNYGFSIGSKFAAQASCLAKAGMNVSTEASVNKIKSYHPYLDLVDENFLVTDYCNDVDDLITYLNTPKAAKYTEIKDTVVPELKGENKTQKLSAVISNLTNDIKRYKSALITMADTDASDEIKKNARSIKKDIEKNWIGKKLSVKNKQNRESMLKTAISVGAYLRTFATSEDEDNLFKPLYGEVKNLSLLQKFTNKIFFKAQQGFGTSRKTNNVTVKGETFMEIPFIGKTNLTMAYSDTESPLYSENSQDIIITTQLPIINGKLYGCETLQNKLKKIISKISSINNKASLTLSDSLVMVEKNFDNVAANYGIEKTLSVPTVFSMGNYMNLHFYLTTIPKTEPSNDLIPIPDSDLIEKDEDTMILKLTKRIDSLNTDLNLKPESVNIRASHKLGKTSSKIGSNSFVFIVNKFNTCELGKNSAAVSGLWERFKQGQQNSLEELFKNINNKDSNARYELQSIYSMIIKNMKTNPKMESSEQYTMLKTAENLFRNFLSTCKELSESKNDNLKNESYEKATSLLDSILKLNYDLVWYPALRAANNK